MGADVAMLADGGGARELNRGCKEAELSSLSHGRRIAIAVAVAVKVKGSRRMVRSIQAGGGIRVNQFEALRNLEIRSGARPHLSRHFPSSQC